VVLSALTFVHSGNFKDNISFWQDVVRTSPHSSLAHGMLGEIYRKKGQLSEAETEYIKCLEIKPDDLMTTVDLAVLYMQENRMEDSEKLFNKALTLNIKSEQVREFITKNLDQVRLMRGKNTGKKVQ